MRSLRWALAIALVVAAAAPTLAQNTEPDPPFPVTAAKPTAQPTLFKVGRAATFHGTVDVGGEGFTLEGLTMLTPVALTVIAEDPKRPVELRAGKTWAKVDRSATTDASGFATLRFRTDDVAKLRVVSTEGTRGFALIAWVGDERTDFPDWKGPLDFGRAAQARSGAQANAQAAGSATTGSAAKDMAAPAAGSAAAPTAAPAVAPAQAAGGSVVLWVIAGLLGVLVLLVAVVVLRRKK